MARAQPLFLLSKVRADDKLCIRGQATFSSTPLRATGVDHNIDFGNVDGNFVDRNRSCVRLLLAAGADPTIGLLSRSSTVFESTVSAWIDANKVPFEVCAGDLSSIISTDSS